MKYFLLTFNKSWADEFDVSGFRLVDEGQFAAIVKTVGENANEPFEYHFGTNQGFEPDYDEETIVDVWTNDVTVSEISEDTYTDLRQLFGTDSFGHFPGFR